MEGAALCDSHGSYLFMDELYRGLEHESEIPPPGVCEVGYDRAISLGGMSKVYGMPGIRIGWLATTDKILAGRLAELKDYTSICPPAPSEILALIGLRARKDL